MWLFQQAVKSVFYFEKALEKVNHFKSKSKKQVSNSQMHGQTFQADVAFAFTIV